MKNFKYIIPVLIFCFISCDEDILDKVNQNGPNSDNFLQFEGEAEEATTAIYDVLTHVGMYKFSFLILGDVPTDNVENGFGDGRYGPDIVRLHNYNWDETNFYFAQRWNGAYKGIYRANYVLENLDNVVDFKEGKREELEGQALFLRALYYYNLVAGFGDIPLVTSLLTAEEINSINKSTAEEVWAQIDNDLSRASDLLPVSWPAEEVGRATKGAAYGLLSRIRLWTGDFSGAEDAADQVDGLGYSLVSTEDYIKMFDGRMENSSESIFEAQFVPGFGNFFSDEGSESSLLMHIFPRVPWGRYVFPRKTDSYDIINDFENDDIRRAASMLISGVDSIFYVEEDRMSIFPDLTIHTDFRLDLQTPGAYQTRKWLPYDTNNWQRGGAFFNEGTAINIPVIRYAEVILNKAEALAEQNKLAEAAQALELIRTRAGLAMTDVNVGDQEALLAQIRNDRRIELIFEGHRWFDLKRWGQLDKLSDAGLNYQGQSNWFIPGPEKDINPNL
ncbi:RagB/SusD family nutrient uptake outer membrane protein [Aquimarina sp. RZ0]|uniref:RagB/SusD family nutrient uptake outer membrane protein n=1 Tax=Aquimarina sp. RZ0 TaxID=2607730 RepID=UPI0011F0B4A1|nr:RagB/SusD family nutrient uptake outer membrane protein [Aquimarina sp. RZ0]KAA1247480.1 RagB/SusD family nutrient uptake outer membrane protein [Aquimarina sp. RZ0]